MSLSPVPAQPSSATAVAIGCVNLPFLAEVLSQAGIQVVSGPDYKASAKAIKESFDAGQPVVVLVSDEQWPGWKAWCELRARSGSVVVLRVEGGNRTEAAGVIDVALPERIDQILAAVGVEVAAFPALSGAILYADGTISSPTTVAVSAPSVPVAAEYPAAAQAPVEAYPAASAVPAPAAPVAESASGRDFEGDFSDQFIAPVSTPVAPIVAPSNEALFDYPTPVQPVVEQFQQPTALVESPWDEEEATAPVPTEFAAPAPAPAQVAPIAAPQPIHQQASQPVVESPWAEEEVIAPAPAPVPSAPFQAQAPVAAQVVVPVAEQVITDPWSEREQRPFPTAAPISAQVSAQVSAQAPAQFATEVPAAAAPIAPVAPPVPAAAFEVEPAIQPQRDASPVTDWRERTVADVLGTQPDTPAHQAPVENPWMRTATPGWDAEPAGDAPRFEQPTAQPSWLDTTPAPEPAPEPAPAYAPVPTQAPAYTEPTFETSHESREYTDDYTGITGDPYGTPTHIPDPAPVYPGGTGFEVNEPSRSHSALSPYSAPGGDVCVVWAPKGGVGKDAISAALAQRAAATYGKKVVLVDGNVAQGNVRRYLKVARAGLPSIFDAAIAGDLNSGLIGPDMLNAARDPRLGRLDHALLLAPPNSQVDLGVVTPGFYLEMIERARRIADLVVVNTQIVEAVDSTGMVDDLVVPIWRAGGWGVGITDHSAAGMGDLPDRLRVFNSRGAARARMLTMMNRVTEIDFDVARLAKSYNEFSQFLGIVHTDEELKQAMNYGRSTADMPTLAPMLDAILARLFGGAQPTANHPGQAFAHPGGFGTQMEPDPFGSGPALPNDPFATPTGHDAFAPVAPAPGAAIEIAPERNKRRGLFGRKK